MIRSANKVFFDLNDYPFLVRKMNPDEGEGFVVEFQDLPYCAAVGDTPGAAIKESRLVLKAALEALAEAGHKVPKPAITVSGQWRQRVPRSLHALMIVRAEQEGVSLNTLAATLLAEGMGRRFVKE